MKNTNQIILGSGGTIGTNLAKALKNYTNNIYLYSRNPQKVNEDDQLIKGDLLNQEQVVSALLGMDIAYLVVGVPYNTITWEKEWPIIMKNVIEACKLNQVRLVFFDNFYMYDPDFLMNATENTPIKPLSRKGSVRASIVADLVKEIYDEKIKALVARSANFYGLETSQSMFNEVVIKRIMAGKKAQWFIDANKKHSLTSIKDAANATALLGNTESAYQQVWHLPTEGIYTANELVEIISTLTNKKAKIQVTPRWLANILGLFIPIIKESKEMLYQFDRDFVFSSQKFEKAFGIKPTPLKEVLNEIILTNQKK